MDPVFKGGLPIKEAQIIQDSLLNISVNYVPADGFRITDLGELATRIRDRLGLVEVEFNRMTSIPRTSRGKFRSVICNVDAKTMGFAGVGDKNGKA